MKRGVIDGRVFTEGSAVSGRRSSDRYVAVTPARDEEEFLPSLIESLAGQTCRPIRWIMIDDGSEDATGEIVDRAAARYPWIESHHLPRRRERAPGGESVIMRFLPEDKWRDCDAILRLDADLGFEPTLAERLLSELDARPGLGIAGPTLWEKVNGHWRERLAPSFHSRGAVKMYSRECFEAIGGLEAELGWDTIDEVRALTLGFTTRSFRHITAYHFRPQGAASGTWQSRKAAGTAAYRIGYSSLFLTARAIRLAMQWPPIVGGAALITGFVESSLRGDPRSLTPAQVNFVRQQQRRRLAGRKSIWR